jgi:hypothetical protein
MTEVVVTKGDETDTATKDETRVVLGPQDTVVIRTGSRDLVSDQSRTGPSASERATRMVFRAAAIGGITGVLVAGLVNRRRIVTYLPEPHQLADSRQRKRYVRRTLRSLEQTLG